MIQNPPLLLGTLEALRPSIRSHALFQIRPVRFNDGKTFSLSSLLMATSSNIVQFTPGSSIADLHGGDFAEEIVALIVDGLDLKGLALKFWFGVECCDAGGRLEIRDSRRDVGGQTWGEMSL
jgi:hypothetical protein